MSGCSKSAFTTPLAKYVDIYVAHGYSDRVSKRSSKIILTNEARVLKALRLEHRLSMKEAGRRAGLSDSMIAHIETGRTNPPVGERLERLLAVYGGIKLKSYWERVRRFQSQVTPKHEALELVERLNDHQLELILPLLKAVASSVRQPPLL